MLRHLVIGAVQIRLIAARSCNSSARIIRHQQPGDALEKLESAHMTVNPVRQILAERRSRKRVRARAEHSNEDRCWRGLSGCAIMDRHGVAGPVNERLLSSLVSVPQHHVPVPIPPLIQLAKAAIAVAVPMRGAAVIYGCDEVLSGAEPERT